MMKRCIIHPYPTTSKHLFKENTTSQLNHQHLTRHSMFSAELRPRSVDWTWVGWELPSYAGQTDSAFFHGLLGCFRTKKGDNIVYFGVSEIVNLCKLPLNMEPIKCVSRHPYKSRSA